MHAYYLSYCDIFDGRYIAQLTIHIPDLLVATETWRYRMWYIIRTHITIRKGKLDIILHNSRLV